MRCPVCGNELYGSDYTTDEDGNVETFHCHYCHAFEE